MSTAMMPRLSWKSNLALYGLPVLVFAHGLGGNHLS